MTTHLRRRAWIATLVAAVFVALPARAQLVEGRDYAPIQPPQATEPAGKIVVMEFFSYGCSHCYDMHPKITKWAASLPANAVFVRVPTALGRREWGVLVRTFYALESLGELERFDTPLFEAIHRDRRPLFDETSVTNWLAQQGVPAGKFSAAYNSEAVSKKSLRAEEMSYNYRVEGTPTVTVGGRYTARGATHDAVLRNARQLIDKVAQELR